MKTIKLIIVVSLLALTLTACADVHSDKYYGNQEEGITNALTQ